MTAKPPIAAAGAVVTRKSGSGIEVLLVHRPKYDDWAFPKGKLDPGEHATAAAVREVEEETGVRVVLGPPLARQQYVVRNGEDRDKVVHYWVGRLAKGEDGDLSSYDHNAEIDALEWVPLKRAGLKLTYERDRETLAEATALPRRTSPLVVLRHGGAFPRKEWRHDDRDRPLADEGRAQAQALVPLLAAFGVRRVVSSSSTRCWTTVEPYADAARVDLEMTDALSEEDAAPAAVGYRVGLLAAAGAPAVLCTHRPVLPMVFEALGVEDRKLAAGQLLVVHLHKGAVVAEEILDPGDALA